MIDLWGRVRSRFWTWWMRADNRRQDLRAVLGGACNASTWDPTIPGYRAYSHWRCAKKRGHQTLNRDWGAPYDDFAHRFNNYIWEGPGHKVEFAPLPVRRVNDDSWKAVTPFQKLAGGRRGVSTRRHSRIMYKANQARIEVQRAQRRDESREARAARLNGAMEAAFRRAHLPAEPLPYPNEHPTEGIEAPQPLRPNDGL